ncbi:CTD kinase subunit beta-like protein [Hapsidospora chrysogenum ATCC 11550]|uniref:RNA polymerase II holoenzyme cyclin-like subunit n=1 Tax=Hapsidospora chrysogenum (strain ATCC 11550 / CBS 779.69 / DSM 880 / IAM 14645 / JCM 23072 / IMI 49137) TaxID=857340 RepID=A0A086STK7_HAPC1|nr:CTD kinase subunit beta-like protein [Hapsidospora chrysogenum ATCC 11550]
MSVTRNMAPPRPERAPPASNGDTSSSSPNKASAATGSRIGPHPGLIKSSNQYTPEDRIRRLLVENGSDPAREDNNRLQGVQLLDAVRQQLQLPVRTFDTACVYFHRFRLAFRDAEYNYQDAALASLFVACKVEDTIKKSKDILAAAYNVKNPDKPAAPDDKIFDSPGKIIIGLERLILETIGFDFRTRYPQKLLVKVTRRIIGRGDDAKPFFTTAYAMSIDMYKTFAPIKRTTFSMVMAISELTARLLGGGASGGTHLDAIRDFAAQKRAHYSRPAVMETMLDLLDLYVQHHKSTKLGTRFDLGLFMDIKIQLNQDLERDAIPRHMAPQCPRCEPSDAPSDPLHHADNRAALTKSPAATATPASSSSTAAAPTGPRPPRGQDGTMRFVFDPEAARAERDTVGPYFREEFEEYEVEVDEPVPPPPRQHQQQQHPPSSRRDDDGGGRGGGGARGGGRRHRDRGWGAPYPGGGGGGGGGGYRGDRPRGRGRYR